MRDQNLEFEDLTEELDVLARGFPVGCKILQFLKLVLVRQATLKMAHREECATRARGNNCPRFL